ncbi:LiaF transmembrane domain-containing protein [Anaerovorax odorimutans]|uniref:LiaF transmembrane domain-containing protein n=1 Tax=Anaerovorax odorimutans TaxID=109327 RepID=UPI0003FBB7EE|nr:LiaF domain-containing protein [Anaerovorax odorimutans]
MKKERIFWGILFIVGAVFLIISKLGYFPDINIFSLLLSVFLIVIIIKSLIRINFTGVFFPIAFLCIIYDKQLGITNITPWTVLIAALLGSIGFSMIFHKRIRWDKRYYNSEDYKFEKINVEDESYVNFNNSFGASIKYVNTDNFEQGDFNCSFGAMKVYFDNAVIPNGNAVANINASFSGIELYIPKTWKIEDKTKVFLGAISEKNKNEKITTETLTLVGDIRFAGVEIIYI